MADYEGRPQLQSLHLLDLPNLAWLTILTKDDWGRRKMKGSLRLACKKARQWVDQTTTTLEIAEDSYHREESPPKSLLACFPALHSLTYRVHLPEERYNTWPALHFNQLMLQSPPITTVTNLCLGQGWFEAGDNQACPFMPILPVVRLAFPALQTLSIPAVHTGRGEAATAATYQAMVSLLPTSLRSLELTRSASPFEIVCLPALSAATQLTKLVIHDVSTNGAHELGQVVLDHLDMPQPLAQLQELELRFTNIGCYLFDTVLADLLFGMSSLTSLILTSQADESDLRILCHSPGCLAPALASLRNLRELRIDIGQSLPLEPSEWACLEQLPELRVLQLESGLQLNLPAPAAPAAAAASVAHAVVFTQLDSLRLVMAQSSPGCSLERLLHPGLALAGRLTSLALFQMDLTQPDHVSAWQHCIPRLTALRYLEMDASQAVDWPAHQNTQPQASGAHSMTAAQLVGVLAAWGASLQRLETLILSGIQHIVSREALAAVAAGDKFPLLRDFTATWLVSVVAGDGPASGDKPQHQQQQTDPNQVSHGELAGLFVGLASKPRMQKVSLNTMGHHQRIAQEHIRDTRAYLRKALAAAGCSHVRARFDFSLV